MIRSDNPRIQLILKVLLLSLGLFALITGIYSLLAEHTYAIEIKTSPLEAATGGGPGCPRMYYDRSGTIITMTNTFSGTAPIYRLVPPDAVFVDPPPVLRHLDNTPPRDPVEANECFYPRQITGTTLSTATPHYPLLLFVAVDRSEIKSGESMQLASRAELVNSFTPPLGPQELRHIIPVSSTNQLEVEFLLYTTTFDVSPSLEERRPFQLELFNPITQSWIISPKSRALSDQVMRLVLINSERLWLAGTLINLEVRDLTGLPPVPSALLVAAGAVIMFIVNFGAKVLEFLKLRRDSRRGKRVRLGKRRKPKPRKPRRRA